MKLYYRIICTLCGMLLGTSFIMWLLQDIWQSTASVKIDRYNSSNTQEVSSIVASKYGKTNLNHLSTGNEFSNIQKQEHCNGSFIGFNHKFALLTNVVILPDRGVGRSGGENISQVQNQREDDEYYTLQKGYFTLRCLTRSINYEFNKVSHLNKWLNAVELIQSSYISERRVELYTLAVQRYEYANLYHTMTDFYNVFFMLEMFNIKVDNVLILFLDGHPQGALDTTWGKLFNGFIRASDIKQPTMFTYMLWPTVGYDSPLNKHEIKGVPKLEEFRTFFLRQHGIAINDILSCDNLRIVLLWRRDYVAHPRNPSGTVSRKIKNEEELVAVAKKHYSEHSILDVQIDLLDMRDQLKMVSQTDILIGMHGAGLSHTLFLPRHAGLIELYPTYWSTANVHFKSMARWRGLHYRSWQNSDITKELNDKYTVVDVNSVMALLSSMVHEICTS
ncbi:uncharacterized protein LOC127857488 isoform X2 [Dreissena polymorpha]|uniref:uncharacterized protein LOC127857488 isoform X2 n=1 Tax=Dreissena polymorpha TaxID=45954 RepID=UPI0022640046|nr:uncharacterized protein LOC127857488 isoform X2 [Dreissena polymorpha]